VTEDDLQRKYKVILSNPPFAGMLPKESVRKDLPTNSKKSELLFLGLMMQTLAPGGRCAVIVPEGLLFGSTNAHKELRKKLVEDFDLLAVISLPAGIFKPYAGVKTGVLVFQRPKGAKKKKSTGKVWFYEVKNDGFDPDKITGGGRPETPDKNDIPELIKQWHQYKDSNYKKPLGDEAGAILPPETEEPTSWWATSESIVANEYNLAAGSYKPQIAETAPEEKPDQLIKEILSIENSITSGLKTLLNEIGANE
jgi:type I restriction enzyme M protein